MAHILSRAEPLWSSNNETPNEGPIEMTRGILEDEFDLEQDQYGVVYALTFTKAELLSLAEKIKEMWP